MFFNDNKRLEAAISGLEARVRNLELEAEKTKTHINSLRGLINRKLGNEPEKKDLNSPDGLDELRGI